MTVNALPKRHSKRHSSQTAIAHAGGGCPFRGNRAAGDVRPRTDIARLTEGAPLPGMTAQTLTDWAMGACLRTGVC